MGKRAEGVTVLSQLILALENPEVDVIFVSADIFLDGRQLPPITRTMILRGTCSDGCTLDASGRSRHLSIGSNLDGLPGHVVLENLILRNGRITASYEVGLPSNPGGGNKKYSGRRAEYAGCKQTQGGGSIFVGDDSTLKMLDCALVNNKAENSVRDPCAP